MSADLVIAYDLGTGGLKGSLHTADGRILQTVFLPYATAFPRPGYQEQRPQDWWDAVCKATALLLQKSGRPANAIKAAALSGQSLAPVLLNAKGELLLNSVPIWSDTRAANEANTFFASVPYQDWYLDTGNGDPAETYTVMKLMWIKRHLPDVWAKTAAVLGSKDYINYRLTGCIATDFSYASGSGCFSLKELRYRKKWLSAAGISPEVLPPVVNSHHIVGTVQPAAAAQSGLPAGAAVACGGVDNTCMALGALGMGEGRIYTSLGSSAWIALTSKTPVLDAVSRPFIFAHAEKGVYTSGVSIFAAGRSYQWAAGQLCADLPQGKERYAAMDALAAKEPSGAGGVLFNPSLAGGSSQEPSPQLCGAFAGITLSTTRGQLLRAVLEGVALSLKVYCLNALRQKAPVGKEMLLCGGGAKSPLWNQIFADVFGMEAVRTKAEENAASLGAAAMALRALGLWKDYSLLDGLYPATERYTPNLQSRALYKDLEGTFDNWNKINLPIYTQLGAKRV